jgi:hypothetical protein
MLRLLALVFLILTFKQMDEDSGVFCWSRSHHPITVECRPAPLVEV